MARVGSNQIRRARQADLFEYLLDKYGDTVEQISNGTLRSIEHDSLIIVRGHGYKRFSMDKGESREANGNAIDYLTTYLGYSFVDAVRELIDYAPESDALSDYAENTTKPVITPKVKTEYQGTKKEPVKPAPEAPRKEFTPPEPIQGIYKHAIAYLHQTRKIDTEVIYKAINDGILYEDAHHNCIFRSKQCSFAELCGTSQRFKQCIQGSYGFWAFIPCSDESVKNVYLCESAIDAMSLYCLRKDETGAYISLYGCIQHNRIKMAVEYFSMADSYYLCVDNDDTGNKCYPLVQEYLPDIIRLLPENKDWNEDLKKRE